MTAQVRGIAVALAREFVHAVGDGRVRRRLEKLPLRVGICDFPLVELLLLGFLLVFPLHLPAQPARRCPTRFGATLHVARCQCHRMRVFHPPRPLAAANGPRHRAGMVAAMRHKQFYRKTIVTIGTFRRFAACLRPRGDLRLVPAVLPSPPTDVEATHIWTTDMANQETSQGAPVMLPVLYLSAGDGASSSCTALSLMTACLCG